MIGDLVRRVVNVAVFALATSAFFLLPVGGKAMSEHTMAILTTPPAKAAGVAIRDTASDLARRVMREVEKLR